MKRGQAHRLASLFRKVFSVEKRKRTKKGAVINGEYPI
jgi:hypothetical protein